MTPTSDSHFSPVGRATPWSPLALLAVALLCACADPAPRGDDEPVGSGAPQPGGTFRLAQDPPGILDPARLDDSYEAAIVNQLFDGLLAQDANLNPVPAVAHSWTISQDGRVYTMQLRHGVLFHDGSECTSEDVVYSLSRVFTLEERRTVLAREYLSRIDGSAEFAAGLTPQLRGLEALGPYQVRITLEKPYASFLSVLASEMARLVPKAYVERVGDDVFGLEPVGCGPFRFAIWEPGKQIVLTRFENYYGHMAQLDSVVFELPQVGHRDYAAKHFPNGHITAVEVQGVHRPEILAVPGVQIVARQELSLAYMALNVTQPPFDDARVRRALLLAIDRERLAQLDADGRHAPSGILPPGMPGFDPDMKLPKRDVVAARALLAEAGYSDAHPLPKIVHASANESANEKALHFELRRQLAEVGFQVETVYLGWLEFDARIRHREFHAFTLIWVADIPDPDAFLTPLFHGSGSNNLYSYRNAAVDSMLNDARSARSAAQRWELYRSAERLILSDSPVAPLFHNVSTIALQPDVRGFNLTPLGVGSFSLEEVWLAKQTTPQVAR